MEHISEVIDRRRERFAQMIIREQWRRKNYAFCEYILHDYPEMFTAAQRVQLVESLEKKKNAGVFGDADNCCLKVCHIGCNH